MGQYLFAHVLLASCPDLPAHAWLAALSPAMLRRRTGQLGFTGMRNVSSGMSAHKTGGGGKISARLMILLLEKAAMFV